MTEKDLEINRLRRRVDDLEKENSRLKEASTESFKAGWKAGVKALGENLANSIKVWMS